MSFKEQLRDWLGGLWHDFWHVPLRQLLGGVAVVLWAVGWLVWRTYAAIDSSVRTFYHAFSLPYALLGLLIVIFAFPKRIR